MESQITIDGMFMDNVGDQDCILLIVERLLMPIIGNLKILKICLLQKSKRLSILQI